MKNNKKKRIYIISPIILILLTCAGCSSTAAAQVLAESSGGSSQIIVPEETASLESNNDIDAGSISISDYEDLIISLYKIASPSVVNITSVDYVFNRMLGQYSEEGVGSGFVYDTLGHIITNYHVIDGADELIITLANGEEYLAEVIGVDAINDLAVLLIDAGENLPNPLPLADTSDVHVGETVLAIGNPYGLDQTLTTGVVSALGRVIESTVDGQYIAEAIQTDAAINPGNSGGPLLNTEGEVIGINSQIVSTSGSSAGVGFAISANTVQRIVPEVIANGAYLHPWLGVGLLDLTEYSISILSEAGMDMPVETGALVVSVERGSPADEADIQSGNTQIRYGPYTLVIGGDIIVGVDDEPVRSQQDLMVYLETYTRIGDSVELTIIRDGKLQTITVRLTL